MSSGSNAPRSEVRLSTSLAQRIVDELAPALQENLNLMDASGFIIASRDPARVGTLHPGAREAAMRNDVVHVHAETARPGERPGVNLPLTYRDRVIGVLGVTGPPEKVQALAPVLKLTIGMLFEREAELDGESQRDAADRDILARLVHGSRPEHAFAPLARRSPSVPGPWSLVLGVVRSGSDVALDARTVARLRQGLGPNAIVGALRGVLWVLFGDRRAGDRHTEAETHRAANFTLEKALARIAVLVPGISLVRTGVCASEAELIREAGHLAVLSTRPEMFAADTTPRHVRSTRLRLAAATLPPGVAQTLASVLAELTPGELSTLRDYLASGNAAELSRTGYAHRNTVQRRLQGIAAKTGYEVRVPADAAVLALALAAADEL